MNILDAVSIRLPCNACGQTYQVPLRDVLLSHTVVRCGCPVTQETECPPVFQVRLFDREPIEALSSAWERLANRAHADGGDLVISATESQPTANDVTVITGEDGYPLHSGTPNRLWFGDQSALADSMIDR